MPTNARTEGARAATALQRDYEVDTVLASSDDLALGVLDIGGGVAVTGWDDSDVAEAAGLTTVAQSLYDQGHDAARWVLGSLREIPPAEWSLKGRTSTRLS